MASDEREVCKSFGGRYSTFSSSRNTALRSSQVHRSFDGYYDISRHNILRPSQTCHSFENIMSLTGSAESNELDSEALYENTVSGSLNLNLNLSQLQIEYSNLVELSDSSNQSESDDDNITSQHKYLFNIRVDDTFGTFDEVEKKLNRYAMERGFAVRKSCTHTRDDGTV
ncbi:hypothetical protein F8M41_017232 [Gigaspora margarita]|uniref:Uncharacterized protein n=1 Tax=Gigaspora margarita TaxID=4874 RepID=A0A8H4EMC6_GIGMA|nr:hypothetical protein F8M41_017232 [Gigaspora margarita]